MKKCLEIIVSVFVLAVGLSLPVAAQDATYSCGTYGAGDYSTHDCATSSGGGATSGETETSSSSGGSSGMPSGGQSVDGQAEGSTTEEGSKDDPEPEGGLFVIIFAKLAASWGWVTIFILLVIAGAVLIGVTRRKKKNRDQ